MLPILGNIDIELSTTIIINLRESLLALEQLNQLLNRLAGELKSQVLKGKLKMFPKFFIIDALILMVVFQLNLTKYFYLLHNWDALILNMLLQLFPVGHRE